MKFIKKCPKSGDERTRTIFLWFPVSNSTIDKDDRWTTETRWLEFATVQEEYSHYDGWKVVGFKNIKY